MRLLFTTSDSKGFVSGVHSWLKRFVLELEHLGHECVFLVITFDDGPHPFIEFLTQHNFSYQSVNINYFRYTPKTTNWIVEKTRQINPDVFIPGFSVAGLYAIPWIKQMGITTVNFIHSDDKFWRAVTERFVLNQDKRWNGDITFSVSKFIYNSIGSGLPEHYYSPCSVNQSAHKAQYDNPLKVIYFGRIEEEQKRILDTARGMMKVVAGIPGVEFAIYGSGNAVGALEELIKTECTDLPIQYFGSVDSADATSLLSKYQVFLLLSDYEGLPVSLLEAMSCGLVPVCMNIQSGINELVINNFSGFIVNNRYEDVFNAVQTLKQDESLWRKMSDNCINTIGENFSIEKQAVRFAEIIKNFNAKQQHVSPDITDVIDFLPAHPDLHYGFEDVRQAPLLARITNKVRGILNK